MDIVLALIDRLPDDVFGGFLYTIVDRSVNAIPIVGIVLYRLSFLQKNRDCDIKHCRYVPNTAVIIVATSLLLGDVVSAVIGEYIESEFENLVALIGHGVVAMVMTSNRVDGWIYNIVAKRTPAFLLIDMIEFDPNYLDIKIDSSTPIAGILISTGLITKEQVDRARLKMQSDQKSSEHSDTEILHATVEDYLLKQSAITKDDILKAKNLRDKLLSESGKVIRTHDELTSFIKTIED